MSIYSPLAITEQMLDRFVPTRLYIKRHTTTGLKYLGKTIHNDVSSYAGSGTRWTSHLRKHGKHLVVNDWISDWFYNPHDLQDFALLLSETLNVVESDEWANLKPEYGVEGNRPVGKLNGMYGSSRKGEKATFYGKKHSDETKLLISQKNTGQKMPESQCKATSARMLKTNPMDNAASRKKLSETKLKIPKKKCPHCERSFDPGNYAKSHGDKCKMKV